MRALLEPHATAKVPALFLWRRIQGHANVVHAPPSGTWGYHGEGVYEAADAAIPGAEPDEAEACEHLVRRYLAAFGPATKVDLAQWAGLQRVGPIGEVLERMSLRRFRDEAGAVTLTTSRARRCRPPTRLRRRGSSRASTTSSSLMPTARASSATCP